MPRFIGLAMALVALVAVAGGCPASGVADDAADGGGAARDVPSLPDGGAADGGAADDGAAGGTTDGTVGDAPVPDAARGDAARPPDGGASNTPCARHADCPCPDGVCLSTGVCWCPPCETEADCPPGEVCRGGACAALPAACREPVRIAPTEGPATGGVPIVVQGGEFPIGALEWLAVIGDTWLRAVDGGACTLTFLSPPLPPGTYPVRVLYGYPPRDGAPPDGDPPVVGTFTVRPHDGPVGRFTGCRADGQCEGRAERCDLGSGRCVPDLCASLWCPDDACDPVEGCVPPGERCAADGDCRLIDSGCACDAVPASDPREALDDCRFDGCAPCAGSWCDREPLEAACVAGVCAERRAPADGLRCAALAWEDLGRTAGGARHPVLAPVAGGVGLAWTDPVADPSFRYGVVRTTTIDREGRRGATTATVGEAGRKASLPALAARGDGFDLVWLDEHPRPRLLHRAYDADLGPVGGEGTVVEPSDLARPVLVARADGPTDLFWAQHGWRADDGLHRRALDAAPDAAPDSAGDHWPWIVPQSQDWAVARLGERVIVAWRSDAPSLPGLLAATLPLGDAPVQLLAVDGHAVAVAATDRAAAVGWVEERSVASATRQALLVQRLDRDGRPLHAPREIRQGPGAVSSPQVALLGGWTVATWLERETFGADAPYRLRAAVVDDAGRHEGPVRELAETVTDAPVVARVRLGGADEADAAVLVGWAEGRALRWGRWRCAAAP